MAEKVIMPKQGLQMTEGTILSWLVKEGEACEEGKPLFEMETDKLTITMDAPATGTLLKIVHGEGDEVPITHIIAVIGEPGEDISAILAEAAAEGGPAPAAAPEPAAAPAAPAAPAVAPAPAAPAAAAAPTQASKGKKPFTPRAKMRADEKDFDIAAIPGSGPEGLVIERDVLGYAPADVAPKATPLAKKVAEIEGVDLADVKGTGSHGKITKADIMAAVAARAAAVTGGAERGTRVEPMTRMRKVIAQRMVDNLQTEAQAQHLISVDMTNAASLRAAYKKKDIKVSYNYIALYAVSRALMEFPIMNAAIEGDNIVYHDYVNLGMAVAVDAGLVVPNLKNADLMRLTEIGAMSRELAGLARDNKLSLDDMSGGTFTISNLGMFGIDSFTAIINAPESGILALGAITKTPVVVGDDIVVRPIMKVQLSYDHRIMDGAVAAKFLVRVKEYMDEPTLML
jgi:pyruvate dehydrogenase E2 component (dihydrolipoamide acetyltransferase)